MGQAAVEASSAKSCRFPACCRRVFHFSMFLMFWGWCLMILLYGLKADMAIPPDCSEPEELFGNSSNSSNSSTIGTITIIDDGSASATVTTIEPSANATNSSDQNSTEEEAEEEEEEESMSDWLISNVMGMTLEAVIVEPATILFKVVVLILLGPTF